MGMLATVMNALAMQNALEQIGVQTRVQSAIPMSSVCEPYIRRRAERHLEKGRIVIFAAGTGNPFFTTDTGAALRAAEMSCDALFKGTSVDGVYDRDPKLFPDAQRFDSISYSKVLNDNLKVMDATAVALCRENEIPIVVFSIREKGNVARVLDGSGTQTIVTSDRQGESTVGDAWFANFETEHSRGQVRKIATDKYCLTVGVKGSAAAEEFSGSWANLRRVAAMISPDIEEEIGRIEVQ